MASTIFVDQSTTILSAWLNDVNNSIYTPGGALRFPTGAIGANGAMPVSNGTSYVDNTPTQVANNIGLGTGPVSRKNAIYNGNFAVNQRVVSGTVTLAAGAYGHDRWKAGAGGCTYTFATVANVTTLTITAGSLQQIIEGTNLFSGTYTLSWVGTAQGKIGAGSFSASGVTGSVTGGSNLTIEFNTGTLSKVQLEFGTIPTVFELVSFGEEFQRCQRYVWKSFPYAVAPAQNAGSAGAITYISWTAGVGLGGLYVAFPVRMRATPANITFYNPAAANALWRNFSAPGDSGAVSQQITSDSSFVLSNPGVAGDGAHQLIGIHVLVDAEL